MSDPLDPRATEALRWDREAPAPDDARARVASRLGVSSSGSESPRRKEAVARAPGRMSGAGLLAVAFVAGGAVGALVHARLAPVSATRVLDVAPPAPSNRSSAVTASSTAIPAPSAAVSPLAAAPTPVTPAASPAHVGLPQLDAERALLDAARDALVRGDADTALRALDRHARTYRRPMLGEERDALLVQTLVRAGRYDEARTRAEAFRREAPESLFRSAVDSAIASIP